MQGIIMKICFMTRKELYELRLESYRLYGKKSNKKELAFQDKVLYLISYTEDLKRIIRNIREIGGKHTPVSYTHLTLPTILLV